MNYQKMYTLLFNAITDALKQMESQNRHSLRCVFQENTVEVIHVSLLSRN